MCVDWRHELEQSQYSLAEFVENFQLPQVVCVETGYFIGDEETSLSSGRVIQLHSGKREKKMFACIARNHGHH